MPEGLELSSRHHLGRFAAEDRGKDTLCRVCCSCDELGTKVGFTLEPLTSSSVSST